jgi:hypothetical protein
MRAPQVSQGCRKRSGAPDPNPPSSACSSRGGRRPWTRVIGGGLSIWSGRAGDPAAAGGRGAQQGLRGPLRRCGARIGRGGERGGGWRGLELGGGSSVGSRSEELRLSLGASGASRWPDLSTSLLLDTGGPTTLPASPFPAVDISPPPPSFSDGNDEVVRARRRRNLPPHLPFSAARFGARRPCLRRGRCRGAPCLRGEGDTRVEQPAPHVGALRRRRIRGSAAEPRSGRTMR